MTYKTHIAAGTMFGLLLGEGLSLSSEEIIVAAGVSAVASILPDIDKRGSKISNKTGPAGAVLRLFTTHRGFWHTFIPWLILSAIILFFAPNSYLSFAFLAGAASHILLDALNPMGVPLLFPINFKKIHFLGIRTGSLAEKMLFLGLFLMAGLMILQIII